MEACRIDQSPIETSGTAARAVSWAKRGGGPRLLFTQDPKQNGIETRTDRGCGVLDGRVLASIRDQVQLARVAKCRMAFGVDLLCTYIQEKWTVVCRCWKPSADRLALTLPTCGFVGLIAGCGSEAAARAVHLPKRQSGSHRPSRNGTHLDMDKL